jgi:hypothetical protein
MKYPSRSSFEDRIRRLIRDNLKIQAIKEVRSLLNVGLKEAKYGVDQFAQSNHWTPTIYNAITAHFRVIDASSYTVIYRFVPVIGAPIQINGLREAAAREIARILGNAHNFLSTPEEDCPF